MGGRLALRHYCAKWKTDQHPGVYRCARTGAGLRNVFGLQALINESITMSVNTLGTGPRCRGSSDVCLQVTDILAQEQSAIASLSVALGGGCQHIRSRCFLPMIPPTNASQSSQERIAVLAAPE